MHRTQLGSFLFLLFLSISHELKCYEGSKGEIKGESTRTFVEQQCEEGMQYCFESFNYDQTEVTAQCQLRSTDQKLLDICKVGCVNHTDVRIVICCCDTDLCNTSPFNFTNPNIDDDDKTTTTILPPSNPTDEPKQKKEDGLNDDGDVEESSREADEEGTDSVESTDTDKNTKETIPPQSDEAREVRRRRRS